jgi:hypothetical protein
MLFALSGCGLGENAAEVPGGQAEVSVLNLTANEVTNAIVTITGPGIANPIVVPLAITHGKWTGIISQIPAGIDRLFTLSAQDVTGVELYRGEASGVTILPGQLVTVVLNAQQVTAPVPYSNAAPVIRSLVASAVTVAPGNIINLTVAAYDPNPGDTLTYVWTAEDGTFASPDLPMTTWTAPASGATIKITIDVHDQKNAHAKMSLDILVVVGNGQGKADVTVNLNTWPVVSELSSDPTRIEAGQTTVLDLVATDSDGDAITYAWTSDCLGTFSSTNMANPSFTLTAVPANNTCTFTVVIHDGKGGTDTGSLLVAAGSAPIVELPPVVVSAYQSAERAATGDTITFQVKANDPNGTAVTFAWFASEGTLGTPNTTGGTSRIVWTAPTSFTSPTTIRVNITDANGQETVQGMTVNPLLPSWQWVTAPPLPANFTAGRIWTAPGNELFVSAETAYVNGQIPEARIYHFKSGVWTMDFRMTGAQISGGPLFGTSPTDVFAVPYQCAGGYGACGPTAGSMIWHYDGSQWVEQSIPGIGTNGNIQHMAGEANNVYATYGTGILRYNGTSWSVASTSGDVGYGPLAYVGPNEIYTLGCWGYQYWNGTTWTNRRGFDFCDVGGAFGVRANDASLQLWAEGNNNFANGIRAWKFVENPKGSMEGSWGSKYGTYINDVQAQGYGSGIWASGQDNFYVVGNFNNYTEGRIWHWDGITWTRELASTTLTSEAVAVHGTSALDVWVLLRDGRLLHYSK